MDLQKFLRIQKIFSKIAMLKLKLDHGYKCFDNQTITANLTIPNVLEVFFGNFTLIINFAKIQATSYMQSYSSTR